MIQKYFLPLSAAALLTLALLHVIRAQQTPEAPTPPVPPARAPFERTVSGVGVVEARTENIAIGSAVFGLVLEVYVPGDRVGKQVKASEPLFRVDDRVQRTKVTCAEADLATVKAELARLEARPRSEELAVSEARVRVAEAQMEQRADQYRRGQELYARRAMSAEEFRQRHLGYEAARKVLARARAEYQLLDAGTWEPDKAIARAKVARAQAKLKQAQTDLARTVVRAPNDGTVLQVNIRPGEYISEFATRPLVVLGDVSVLHVRVEIDENDLPRFRPGAPARAVLRTQPQEEFRLTFLRVEPYVIPKASLTGIGPERIDTRVLQVVYALRPGAAKVYVGQQLDVFIDAGEKT
jgi:multidrug resistance efflux pump